METTSGHFRHLNLSEELLNKLIQSGFEHPTPIQEQAIPIGMKGADLIGCAQTGTGKTLAFVIPLLERLKGKTGTRALILCPTREIALQTHRVIEKLGGPFRVHSAVVIGGQRIKSQSNALHRHPAIIVATPGRLVDHMERRNVNLRTMEHVILDEADHMLDLGFLPQMRKILSALPEKRQTMMFSATFPRQIEQLAQQYLHHPQRIQVAPPGTTAEGIEHNLYLLEPQHKRLAILELLKNEKESTLVFTRTKMDADWLARLLHKQGHSVHALHADRTQSERGQTLEGFKRGDFQILVATDIMARGIDVIGIAHVVNFDIPENPEDYVHRVGRTARYKATGRASVLATWMQKPLVEAIEKILKQKIPRREIPGIPAFVEVTTPQRTIGKIGRRGKRVRMR